MYSIINDPSLNTINNNSITYPNNLYYNNNLIVYQNIINNYINYFQHTLHYLENCNYTMQQLNVNLYNSINPHLNNNPYYNNTNHHYNNNYSSNNTDMNNDVINNPANNNVPNNNVPNNNVSSNTNSDNDSLVTPSFRFPDILLQAINNINNYYREYNQSDYQNSIEYFREISNKNIDDVIINNINRKYFYEIRNPINIECGITQEEFSQDDEVAVIEECGHIFTYNNLFQWCRTNLTCPNCRYNMLIGQNLIKYTENDNTQFYIFTPTQIAEFITFRSRNILESA